MNADDAVAETAAYIDQSARDRVSVSGPDAQSYLHSQLSQEVRDLAVGAARWTFVLDPSGKIDVLARVHRTADDVFVLDTDAGFGEALMARIKRFKIRVDAEVELEAAGASDPATDIEAARIGAGWPRMGAEIEPGSTIPATTGIVLQAANFQKGCYPGQELVERMDSRGADAPRSLRIVDVAGAKPGDDVADADGGSVGTVTSATADAALAYVRRGVAVGRPPVHLA
ncbi:MAG: folate-binding protein YgfZ [Ilumatobacter sp.]